MPPPSRPEITAPDDAGMIHIRGEVRSSTEVFAKNQSSLEIVGEETDNSGKYDLVMQAEVNDLIIVWYATGSERSDFVEVLVPAPSDGSGSDGGASGE